MASFFREVFKGIQAGIAEEKDALERLRKSAKLAGTLASELAAAAALTPYGLRAVRVKRLLPLAFTQEAAAPSSLGVVLFPDIRYGPAPRQQLDVYVPQQLYHVMLQHQGSVTTDPDQGSSQPQPDATSPSASSSSSSSNGLPAAPVVFFCHGGIWATGERWHFCPMATRLAQAGCVVVVISYTLYPDALATSMACEVLQALLWTLGNVTRFLGDPHQVTVMGHSAGGHLGALALLLLAQQRHHEQKQGLLEPTVQQQQQQQVYTAHLRVWQAWEQQAASSSTPESPGAFSSTPFPAASVASDATAAETGGSSDSSPSTPLRPSAAAAAEPAATGLARDLDQQQPLWLLQAPPVALPLPLPVRFIGMSGVYDVPKHLEYETARGVHHLSTMARACGGAVQMADVSPVRILQRAVQQQQRQQQQQQQLVMPPSGATSMANPASSSSSSDQALAAADCLTAETSFYSGFELAGEAIPARAGLHPEPAAGAGGQTPLAHPSCHGSVDNSSRSSGGGYVAGCDGGTPSSSSSSSSSSASDGSSPVLHRNWHDMDAASALRSFCCAAAKQLPPFILMSSCRDHMVPWHEAAEMAAACQACGVPVKHLIYNAAAHNDFVLDWPVQRSPREGPVVQGWVSATTSHTSQQQQQQQEGEEEVQGARSVSAASGMPPLVREAAAAESAAASGMPSFAVDLVRIATGAVAVRYAMSRL